MSTSCMVALGFVVVVLGANVSLAEDDKGYTRADGVHVEPQKIQRHTRSNALRRPSASARARAASPLSHDDDDERTPHRRDADDPRDDSE